MSAGNSSRTPGKRAARAAKGGGETAGTPAGGEDRRPGRPPLRDDPRAQILLEAAKLFAEKGYAASSLTEVAAAMNYSKGAIYNYFASKQEIYDAIIIFTLTGLYETGVEATRLDAADLEASHVDARAPERLRRFMAAHARFLADHYDAFVTMLVGFSGMSNAELKDDALKLRDAHEGLLRAIIAEGVAEGSFRPVDPAMTGRAVLSLLSWMARWFKPGGPKSAEEIADEYYDLMVHGMVAVPAP